MISAPGTDNKQSIGVQKPRKLLVWQLATPDAQPTLYALLENLIENQAVLRCVKPIMVECSKLEHCYLMFWGVILYPILALLIKS